MKTIRVIGGSLKGKNIPFDNNKYDQADISPQKIKGAVFSILGEELSGQIFLDLFAASGQIGIEACSRGAEKVVFNELEKKRYFFIKNIISNFGLEPISKIFLS